MSALPSIAKRGVTASAVGRDGEIMRKTSIKGAVPLIYMSIFLMVWAAFLLLYPKARREEAAATSVKVKVGMALPQRTRGTWAQALSRLSDESGSFELVDRGDAPEILLCPSDRLPEGYSVAGMLEIPPTKLKIADWQGAIGDGEKILLCVCKDECRIKEVVDLIEEKAVSALPEINLSFAGDIIPSRTVAKQMRRHGVLFPFKDMAPYPSQADLAWGNLECPLSDRYPSPGKGVAFIAPSETVRGLELCGFDVLNLANNHSTNFGTPAFLDTLSLLEERGIRYVGGGRDKEEAYSPLFLEVKGIRLAFLGFNCVAGSLNAGPARPGVAWVDLPPYGSFDREDEELVRRKVEGAREKADFLVVSFHWGEEYKHKPSPFQVRLARIACHAGADMVVSTHPHCVQPVELYGDSLIAYSLGNFVFDQMFADYTREGFVLRCRLRGSRLEEVELVPYLIHDYCRPVPMDAAATRRFAAKMREISGL